MLTSQLCFSEKKIGHKGSQSHFILHLAWETWAEPESLVEGNRDSFKVVPRVVGVYYKRVTRIQCGEWLDPVQPGGPGYSAPPGEQVFAALTPSTGLSFS